MRLLILGASNPEAAVSARRHRVARPDVDEVLFIDNDPKKKGSDFFGFPVIGGFKEADFLPREGTAFVNVISGSTAVRRETSQAMLAMGFAYDTMIDPDVRLELVEVGRGVYVQSRVVIQAAVRLGNNCTVHTSAVIAHEAVIGEDAFVAHMVSLCGRVVIGEGAYVGTNATILPGVRVGCWATVGAGALVREDVPDHATVVGNPARIIRTG